MAKHTSLAMKDDESEYKLEKVYIYIISSKSVARGANFLSRVLLGLEFFDETQSTEVL